MSATPHSLLQKLASMPTQRLSEVEDFVDFLASRDRQRSLAQAAMTVSAPTLAKLWDNPDDAEYDRL